jgi:nicotinamide-nucleotide amidase
VTETVILGDRVGDISARVSRAIDDGIELLVTTGGLGPTADDLTMRAVGDGAGVELEVNAEARRTVDERTAHLPLDPNVRERLLDRQALLPIGAGLIPAVGTAPGARLTTGETLIVVLPGPPWERARMWDWAAARPPLRDLLARGQRPPRVVLRIFAVPESSFVQAVDRLEAGIADRLSIAVCAQDGELEVTLDGPTEALEIAGAHLQDTFGDLLYSGDGHDLDEAVQSVLRAAGQTLAVAESCTGGGLGERITAVPGSSHVFRGGVIAYADAAKASQLGVPAEVLARHGAVSAEVARAMAEGARSALGADWGLSITGVAGPAGGTAEKPVGLVYIGCAGPEGTKVAEHTFRGDRERIRARATVHALHMLRSALT